MNRVAIGVDIGGTNTAIGVVDTEGQVLIKGSIPTPKHGDVNLYIEELAKAIEDMIESVKRLTDNVEYLGIGIGAPNGNYYRGSIEYAPNLSFKGIIPFVDLLKEKFPQMKAVVLTNDANAAAIGEMIYGGAKNMKDFVMYTLGTGVGSGIVVNGEMVYGHDGFAGECGHTMLIPNGRLCGCGSKGHVEAYCSAPGMKRTAFEILVRDNATDSLLANKSFNELDSKMIFDAAQQGDRVALEVFEQTGKWLGQALADTVHHTSPEAIFLFGGPTAAGELLFKPVRESMEAHLLPIFKNKVKVLPSRLKPGDAAIIGASALVHKELAK
ncbi:MAG: ROK family protein [Bacteroidota bacterium]|nr:ROK family protein [Bacteroidota bacterium]